MGMFTCTWDSRQFIDFSLGGAASMCSLACKVFGFIEYAGIQKIDIENEKNYMLIIESGKCECRRKQPK